MQIHQWRFKVTLQEYLKNSFNAISSSLENFAWSESIRNVLVTQHKIHM